MSRFQVVSGPGHAFVLLGIISTIPSLSSPLLTQSSSATLEPYAPLLIPPSTF